MPPEPPTPETRKSTPRNSVQRPAGRKGEVTVIGMHFYIGMNRVVEHTHVLYDEEPSSSSTPTEIISHPRPPKGTVYIGISGPARQPSTKS